MPRQTPEEFVETLRNTVVFKWDGLIAARDAEIAAEAAETAEQARSFWEWLGKVRP